MRAKRIKRQSVRKFISNDIKARGWLISAEDIDVIIKRIMHLGRTYKLITGEIIYRTTRWFLGDLTVD